MLPAGLYRRWQLLLAVRTPGQPPRCSSCRWLLPPLPVRRVSGSTCPNGLLDLLLLYPAVKRTGWLVINMLAAGWHLDPLDMLSLPTACFYLGTTFTQQPDLQALAGNWEGTPGLRPGERGVDAGQGW
jgi:hypothetical protein